MLINEAVKATNLTKKAIRYYEEKGLISPTVNNENGYKEYSKTDIERLKQISFFRNLGMPVSLIKDYLSSEKNKDFILKQFSQNISEQIEELKLANQIIHDLRNSKTTDYEKLNNRLLISQQGNKNYVIKQMLRLFPNAFGKYMIVHFSRFLDEPIDSPRKRQAFNEIIDFFDNLDEISFSKELAEEYEKMDENVSSLYEKMDNKMYDMLNINLDDKTAVLKLKAEMKKCADIRNEMHANTNSKYFRYQNELGKILRASGYYDSFLENMKIISSKYKQYTERIVKLGEVLGVSYDEQGNAVVE